MARISREEMTGRDCSMMAVAAPALKSQRPTIFSEPDFSDWPVCR